jgi:tellurite resistance protein
MRSYPLDSPEAAARIVALTMIADGDVNPRETEILQRLDMPARLGIKPHALHGVLQELCEDLLAGNGPRWSECCSVDTMAINRLLSEVEDPALREQVLTLCVAVAEADDRVSDEESLVLTHAVEQWGMQASMFAPARSARPA